MEIKNISEDTERQNYYLGKAVKDRWYYVKEQWLELCQTIKDKIKSR